MHQSTAAVVVVVAAIVLMSVLPHHGEARSIRGQYVAESNQFTAQEAWSMREERRQEREMVEAMEQGISEWDYGRFERSPPAVDPQQVNEREGLTGFFEGDIVLTEQQKSIINGAKLMGNEQVREQVFRTDLVYRWPKGQVPYVLDKSLNKESINAIYDAMDEIEKKTKECITFWYRGKDRDYIRFKSDDGCYSRVGRVGGEQVLSIQNTDVEGSTCAEKGIAMHEIGHALGRFHEQNRPDRDEYVTVVYDNIKKDQAYNFDKQSSSVATTFGVSYDFDSIMHYGAYDYAIDKTKPTIVPRNPRDKISGQEDHLTDKDVYHIVAAYCPDKKRLFQHHVQ